MDGLIKKRLLLTGGRGFVGTWMQREFADWDVQVIDINPPERGMDVRDYFADPYLDKWDAVIHLAAVVGGRQTIEGSPMSLAVDLSIDAEAFNWAVRAKPKKFVYFSSSAAYPTLMQTQQSNFGALSEQDIDVNDVLTPDHLYGWSKLTGEVLAHQARQSEGLDTIIVRPFSGYDGETQALDYPFPTFIDRAKRKLDPYPIWGDGQQVRDFIHVSDICKAVRYMIENDVPGPVNMGWGRPTSFNDLAEMVTKAAGYSPTFEHLLDKPVGVHYRVADPTYFNSFYTPKISLEAGIEMALGKVRM